MATKLRDLMLLATDLQSSSIGLTKMQLIERCKDRGFEPSKRTIERWLVDLEELGMETELTEVETDHQNTKRYKVRGLPNALLKLLPEERSALERYGQMISDETTKNALNKVLSTQTNLSTAMVNNLQELIEQTAYTGNVQARISVDPTQMRIIEQAIEGLTEVRFKYKTQTSKTATQKQEKPIGLLYGRFGYLVCLGYRDKPIIYRLDLLEEVTSTTQFFVKPEKFNFKEWCNDSFGIYHGDDRIRVVIEFDSVVSRRAEKIKFHSSQQVSKKKDGSVQMVFICKGWKELIYEFMHPDWLGHIKIKEPKELKDAVKDYLKVCKDMI